jgi:hypothetical protein
MLNPQICVNKSNNTVAIYCLKYECGAGSYLTQKSNTFNGPYFINYLNVSTSGTPSPTITTMDMLFLMKDGEIIEKPLVLPTHNYCGSVFTSPTFPTLNYHPLLYLPSIISVNGYYILGSNSINNVQGNETDVVFNMAVYNNIGTFITNTVTTYNTSSTSYYIAKSAGGANSYTHFFMNAKLYIGGQNTIWIIGIGCNTISNSISMPSSVPLFYFINRLTISSNGTLTRTSLYTEQLNSTLSGLNGTGVGSVYFRKIFVNKSSGNNFYCKPGTFSLNGSLNTTANVFSSVSTANGCGTQNYGTCLDHRYYYPDAYVIPVLNDTYIIFSQTSSDWVPGSYNANIFYLYYTLFSGSTYVSGTGGTYTNVKIPLTTSISTNDFVGFNQLLPIGIYITSISGILIVWSGQT